MLGKAAVYHVNERLLGRVSLVHLGEIVIQNAHMARSTMGI